MEASTGEAPKRGEVGRQTYEMVQRLIGEGKKATEAFAEVADQTGRSAATVATAYYRTARAMPGGGGVKQRPRRGRPRGSGTTTPRATRARGGGQSTQALVRQLQEATDALTRHAEQLEAELAQARRDSEAYAQIQRLMSTGR